MNVCDLYVCLYSGFATNFAHEGSNRFPDQERCQVFGSMNVCASMGLCYMGVIKPCLNLAIFFSSYSIDL